MSCKTPILRAVFDSATLQAVAANGTINFTQVTSNTNCATLNGGTISLRTPGDYEVHFNVTTSAAAAGVEEIQMYRNGSPELGAHALETTATAADLASMSFTALVSVECCGNTSISFRSVPATNIRVANVTIEKVDD